MPRPLWATEGPWGHEVAPELLSVALEGELVGLVQVLDAVDVLDGAPGGAGGAAHGVVQGLHDFIVRGAGLLRGREACLHSACTAGRGHGRHRDQLCGLLVQRAFPVEHTRKFLHGSHGILLVWVGGLARVGRGIILD